MHYVFCIYFAIKIQTQRKPKYSKLKKVYCSSELKLYQAAAAVLTRHLCAVFGDSFAVGSGESRQTVTRVAPLSAVTARRAIATRLVVGTEVQI